MNTVPKKVRTKRVSISYDKGAILLMLTLALIILVLTIYAAHNINRGDKKRHQERGPTTIIEKGEGHHQTIQQLEREFLQYHTQFKQRVEEKLTEQQRISASRQKIKLQKLEAQNNYLKKFFEDDKVLYQNGIVSKKDYIKRLKNKIYSVKHLVF